MVLPSMSIVQSRHGIPCNIMYSSIIQLYCRFTFSEGEVSLQSDGKPYSHILTRSFSLSFTHARIMHRHSHIQNAITYITCTNAQTQIFVKLQHSIQDNCKIHVFLFFPTRLYMWAATPSPYINYSPPSILRQYQ